MEYISRSEAETEALGERLARSLPARGVVIAMYGELGAGKTELLQFVRTAQKGLYVGKYKVLSGVAQRERRHSSF